MSRISLRLRQERFFRLGDAIPTPQPAVRTEEQHCGGALLRAHLGTSSSGLPLYRRLAILR